MDNYDIVPNKDSFKIVCGARPLTGWRDGVVLRLREDARLSKHGRLEGRVNRVVVLMFLVVACLLLRQFLAFLICTFRTSSRYLREISWSPNPHFIGRFPCQLVSGKCPLSLSIQDKFLVVYFSCSSCVHSIVQYVPATAICFYLTGQGPGARFLGSDAQN